MQAYDTESLVIFIDRTLGGATLTIAIIIVISVQIIGGKPTLSHVPLALFSIWHFL